MISEGEVVTRLALAVAFGAVVGIERGYREQRAGLRTHMLISLAAGLFTVVSIEGFPDGDTSRVAAQIVSGVGFLGAGAILQLKAGTKGLTTAATIWTSAALGMAAGTGHYVAGATAAGFALVILIFMRPVSGFLAKWELGNSDDE